MLFRTTPRSLLSLAIAGLLSGAVVAGASAQSSRADRSSKKEAPAERYPESTRKVEAKGSARAQSKAKKMSDAFNAGQKLQAEGDIAAAETKLAQVQPLAEEIIADEKVTDYDRAYAALIAANANLSLHGLAENDAQQDAYREAARGYFQRAVELDSLDNDNHFGAMFTLAQLLGQQGKYPEALALTDRYFEESKSSRMEERLVKADLLYRVEDYAGAAQLAEQIIASTPEPKDDWINFLMALYNELEQYDKAVVLAEQLVAKAPDDKKRQINLATVYAEAEQNDKAVAVLEKLRASGQLTEEDDYKRLAYVYQNIEGKELALAEVLTEGMEKGILKSDFQNNVQLAQAYYFAEPQQIGKAIEAWRKAAPLSPNGETWLNLAKVLQNEGRQAEAKEAAQAALDKGVKKPEEAQRIIARKP